MPMRSLPGKPRLVPSAKEARRDVPTSSDTGGAWSEIEEVCKVVRVADKGEASLRSPRSGADPERARPSTSQILPDSVDAPVRPPESPLSAGVVDMAELEAFRAWQAMVRDRERTEGRQRELNEEVESLRTQVRDSHAEQARAQAKIALLEKELTGPEEIVLDSPSGAGSIEHRALQVACPTPSAASVQLDAWEKMLPSDSPPKTGSAEVPRGPQREVLGVSSVARGVTHVSTAPRKDTPRECFPEPDPARFLPPESGTMTTGTVDLRTQGGNDGPAPQFGQDRYEPGGATDKQVPGLIGRR